MPEDRRLLERPLEPSGPVPEPDEDHVGARPPTSGGRGPHRSLVLLLAFTVFAAGGAFAWVAFRPAPTGETPSNGPPLLSFVLQTVIADPEQPRNREHFSAVQTAGPDGSGLRTLLEGGRSVFFTGLAWAPEGTRVAFTQYVFHPGPGAALGPAATIVMNADGTGKREIRTCPGEGCPTNLAWSPDGRSLAFRDQAGLGIMDSDGSDFRMIHTCRGDSCEWVEGAPSWSPDGTKLVFPGMNQDYVGGLFLIDPEGGPLTTVARCYSALCSGGAREASPAWSPDGRLIAFIRERNLFLIRPDGTGLYQVTSCPKHGGYDPCFVEDPAWSPDGAEIAYSAPDGIHVVSRSGSGDRLVVALPVADSTHSYSYCCVSWRPIPGVPTVTSDPTVQPSEDEVGVAPTPPEDVGRSIAPSDWAQFHGTADHASLNPAESAIGPATVDGLAERWTSSVRDLAVMSQSPVVVGGQVFVGAYDGHLYAFAGAGCGAAICPPEWAGATDGSILGTPSVAGGVVYVGSSGGLHAFDASGCGEPTCPPIWIGRTGGPIGWSSPTVADGLVFVGTAWDDSRLYAFDAWGCGAPVCEPVWVSQAVGNGIESSPAVADGVVYTHGMDPFIYAFDASGCGSATCGPLWKGSTHGQTEGYSSPAVWGGHVYVGDGDCNAGECGVSVFRAGGCGEAICQAAWAAATEGAVVSSPAVAGGVLYFITMGTGLQAFDATGCGAAPCSEPLWSASLPMPGGIGSSPAVAGGLVFVRSNAESDPPGNLYAYQADGCGEAMCSPVWSAPAGNDSASSPAVSDGMVFVGGNDAIIHAFGLP